MKIQYLYHINKNLLETYTFYIWGIDEWAKTMCLRILARGGKVQGFVTDDTAKIGISIYGRGVCADIDFELKKQGICIVAKENGVRNHVSCRVILEAELWEVNTAALTKEICVWGAGNCGQKVVRQLEAYQEWIRIFDSDVNRIGKKLDGIPIEKMDLLQDKEQIVLATVNPAAMQKDLYGYKAETVFLTNEVGTNKVYLEGRNSCVVTYRNHFYELLRAVKGKEVFLYDTSDDAGIYLKFLRSLGLQISLVSSEQEAYDLLYVDTPYVLLSDENRALKMKQLEELGLSFLKEYNFLNDFREDLFCKENIVLDPNLGYTVIEKKQHPGFCIYGDDRETNLKILTLGGSTTDGSLYPFMSWSEFLAKLLREKGIPATIYCGGTNGYQVSQEFVKLIRDGVTLKPDIVISYSGLNNLNGNEKYPFFHKYQLDIFECLEKNMVMDAFEGLKKADTFSMGVESEESPFEFWIRMQKYMKACCEVHGISYYGILQPNMLSKPSFSPYEHELEANFGWCTNQASITNAKMFRESVKMESAIYDLSDIFDAEAEVYMDGGHVWEYGNELIARKIFDVIADNFKIKKDIV